MKTPKFLTLVALSLAGCLASTRIAGAYRCNFSVDGVTALDPRNRATTESAGSFSSLIVVPGAEMMDTKNVPHGAVASMTYHSNALSRTRRMQVYTPPSYEKSNVSYPVFYLLHGAGIATIPGSRWDART